MSLKRKRHKINTTINHQSINKLTKHKASWRTRVGPVKSGPSSSSVLVGSMVMPRQAWGGLANPRSSRRPSSSQICVLQKPDTIWDSSGDGPTTYLHIVLSMGRDLDKICVPWRQDLSKLLIPVNNRPYTICIIERSMWMWMWMSDVRSWFLFCRDPP